jgi:hypothetical protein
MDYPFENLDPEKFQEFCQALLVKEFPNVQCFPVAQPDGGRDALAYFPSDLLKRNFIMFQVKYVRNPLLEKDPHKWLAKILEDEAPKLSRQIPNGIKQYILLTNIRGTAHLESGSIDKVNKMLESKLGVPSICLWRDDLNRRLDNAYDLKWSYPELMTGPDLIRSVIESGLSENKEQRASTIRAFVRHQFSIDQEVKFRQVDLQNKLLDLFIDVPIISPRNTTTKKQQNRYEKIYRYIAHNTTRRNSGNVDMDMPEYGNLLVEGRDLYIDRMERETGNLVGAATFLLHSSVQNLIPRIVLEGAPGQGKSTITQYLCQVHRMRLLNASDMLQTLAEYHIDCPIRLPFRVDLRDLATWLAKRDPFSSDSSGVLPDYWHKSLEAFLAAQVRNHSGGNEFNVKDLIAVAKLSSLLLVFDGLDEVADITKRQEVVNEIVGGINRIQENCGSLQVIVTSRPAAFANSPGLPEDEFLYCQLASVTRPLIDEYADKWLKARKLTGREASEVRKILQEKLDQPHLRDLARNPMQLTILLSLIHTRGSSLPDKRTALYDNYVELFFNREAEKSKTVRDNRDLLVNIHRYLAWILHAEAEMGSNSGSITEERLHKILAEYLASEGHDSSLLPVLFTGMVERVVALVSRVEGTYEFEVQPLREYFAARYLYETAPYSPPGDEQRGTKPDRFDAIARNFYWLNVTRFYAGCYSKGELTSLIDRLQELTIQEGYCLISHPRVLSSMLLSDWVFTQHPRSVHEVVSLILDGIGLRYISTSNNRRLSMGNPLVLPKNCGQDELITRCFEILRSIPPRDYALEVIDVVKANATSDNITSLWSKEIRAKIGRESTQWLEYGLLLNVLPQLPLDELCTILSDKINDHQNLRLLFRARQITLKQMRSRLTQL